MAAGDALLAPSVPRRLIAEFARRPEPTRPPSRSLDAITDRELEVFGLIAHGLSNAEIAEHLHLSLATVKTHIGPLLAKLHARDRAQLVIVACETGLVGDRPRGREEEGEGYWTSTPGDSAPVVIRSTTSNTSNAERRRPVCRFLPRPGSAAPRTENDTRRPKEQWMVRWPRWCST